MDLVTLSVDEVLQIHDALVRDFETTDDPISPPGIRSADLLESAVARQWTGIGDTLKYSAPIESAATLAYGICCNHPFYNGNKRTSLVSLLVHLDKNKISLFDTKQVQLYDFMLRVADHTLGVRIDRRKRREVKRRRSADDEVRAMVDWLSSRAAKVVRGERLITYRELHKILESFGFYLKHPKNNSIDIVRQEDVRKGLFKKRVVREEKRIGNIPWPGENRQISFQSIKHVRTLCGLREEDGIDSEGFYNYSVVIEEFVNHYRKILQRLART